MASEINFTVLFRAQDPAAAAQAILRAPVAPVPVAPPPIAPAVRSPRVRHARNIPMPQPAARPASVTYRAIVAFSFCTCLKS